MSWKLFFDNMYKDLKFIELLNNLETIEKDHVVYPPIEQRFNAFHLTPYEEVKVVILGQDPYINEGEANGLAFSSLAKKRPPSLVNMYKSIEKDYGKIPPTGDLSNWAKQGVLLLNTILTVEKGKSLSHEKLGWQYFTKKVIEYLNKKESKIIYLLWGRYAQSYEKYINLNKHLVLKSTHPSPLSFYRGFLDDSPFLKANELLVKEGMEEVNWCL